MDPSYVVCPGCEQEVENLLDHAPDCPTVHPPALTLQQQVDSLVAQVRDGNERLMLRQRTMEAMFALLVDDDLPAQRVERLTRKLQTQLVCGFPYLDGQPELAHLGARWFRQLEQLEDDVLHQRQERSG